MLPLVKVVLPPHPLFSSPLTNNFPFFAKRVVCQDKIDMYPIQRARVTKLWPIGCKMKGCLQFALSVLNEGSSLPCGFIFSAGWDGYQKAGAQAEGQGWLQATQQSLLTSHVEREPQGSYRPRGPRRPGGQ